LLGLSVVLLSLGTGCENLFFDTTTVRLQPISDANGGDVDATDADTGAADAAIDVDPRDATDVSDDVDMDISVDGTDGGDYPFGKCDPVSQSCGAGQYCKLLFESPPDPALVTACDAASNAGDVQQGELCGSPSDCSEQTYCVNWTKPDSRGKQCTPYCILASGEECGNDEFCTNPFDLLDGLGFCTKSCDPYASGCSADTQCHPNPGYDSGQTPEPHFQCLAVDDDFSSDGVGSSCSIEDVNLDGCAPDLVCYPVGDQELCVKPCSASGDCGTTCDPPAGSWDLKYCEL
jgi:hypothetical protein